MAVTRLGIDSGRDPGYIAHTSTCLPAPISVQCSSPNDNALVLHTGMLVLVSYNLFEVPPPLIIIRSIFKQSGPIPIHKLSLNFTLDHQHLGQRCFT